MNICALLEQTDFFKGAGARTREMLAGICMAKDAAKKERLFTEGDRGHAIYLLATGAVGLYKTAADGRVVVIKVVRPGELFAEVVLFEQDRYPVTAVAMTACRLYLLPKRQFYDLLNNVEFRNDFIGMLMKKLRYLADRMSYMATNDVEDRFFIFLREHYGQGESIVPLFSKKDMAAAIGTTPETYSRLLARLSSEGKISVEGKAIRLRKEYSKGNKVK
jgi:CRP-like cAMP-binding protein